MSQMHFLKEETLLNFLFSTDNYVYLRIRRNENIIFLLYTKFLNYFLLKKSFRSIWNVYNKKKFHHSLTIPL